MATPSQQTNQILELMEQIRQQSDPELWSRLADLLQRREQAAVQTRSEFESRARMRGEPFLQQAHPRMQPVLAGFDQYCSQLREVRQLCDSQQPEPLKELQPRLRDATCTLYEALDQYASFYFSWGENQSPLVTMIRQAVESYSRNALQSTQAQRILQDMEEHFKSLGATEEKRRGQEEKSSGQ